MIIARYSVEKSGDFTNHYYNAAELLRVASLLLRSDELNLN